VAVIQHSTLLLIVLPNENADNFAVITLTTIGGWSLRLSLDDSKLEEAIPGFAVCSK